MRRLNNNAKTTEVANVSGILLKIWEKTVNLHNDEYLYKEFSEELPKLSDELTQAINRETVQSNLKEYDKTRDKKYSVLYTLISGYAVNPLTELKEYGLVLLKIISKYGKKLTQKAYGESTALIDSLLKDFSKDVAETAINTLPGIKEAVAELQNAQDSFTTNQVIYDSLKSQVLSLPSASSLRRPLIQNINTNIVQYLNTMVNVQPEKYSEFFKVVEFEIERINSKIETRLNSKDKKEELDEKVADIEDANMNEAN